jgi:hypothetical protein
MFKLPRNILMCAHGPYMYIFILFHLFFHEHFCTAEIYVTGLNPDSWFHEFPKADISSAAWLFFSSLLRKANAHCRLHRSPPVDFICIPLYMNIPSLRYVFVTLQSSVHSPLFSSLYLITWRMFCHSAVYCTRNSYIYMYMKINFEILTLRSKLIVCKRTQVCVHVLRFSEDNFLKEFGTFRNRHVNLLLCFQPWKEQQNWKYIRHLKIKPSSKLTTVTFCSK